MATTSIQELRNCGIQPLVHRLHEHTLKDHDQPRDNTNIEAFLLNFNQKADQRDQLAREIRTILEKTAPRELRIFYLLNAVRAHTEALYSVLSDDKAAESSILIVSTQKQLADLKELSKEGTNCQTIELLGGIFVILDHLRAVDRFCARFPNVEFFCPNSKTIDMMESTLTILHNCTRHSETSDLKVFLGKSRSLIELLTLVMKYGHVPDTPEYNPVVVHLCCWIFYELNNVDVSLKPSTMRSCKTINEIQAMVHFSLVDELPETLYHLLSSLEMILRGDLENVEHLLSIPSARPLLKLVSLLKPSQDGFERRLLQIEFPCNHQSLESSQWYQKVIEIVVKMLANITPFFFENGKFYRGAGPLIDAYQDHDICKVLVNHLKLAPLEGEFTRNAITTLKLAITHLCCMKKVFQQIPDGVETIKKLKDSKDETVAKEAKRIWWFLFHKCSSKKVDLNARIG